ncbi:MAG: DNA gyrase inhibitor YacG [Myxococcaceae bacterium]
MSKLASCPICRKPILPRSKNPLFPFCSARCRAVDLGKWLGEEYRVPDGTADEQEDELPPVPGDEDSEPGQ